jgi:hypothetical protein
MSPSHLTSLFGVLGSELQLERRLRAAAFLLGELGSSADESRSEGEEEKRRKNKRMGKNDTEEGEEEDTEEKEMGVSEEGGGG